MFCLRSFDVYIRLVGNLSLRPLVYRFPNGWICTNLYFIKYDPIYVTCCDQPGVQLYRLSSRWIYYVLNQNRLLKTNFIINRRYFYNYYEIFLWIFIKFLLLILKFKYFFILQKLLYIFFFFYRTTVEQLQNEINALDSRFKVVRKQIELPNTEQDIKNQMIEFLKVRVLEKYNFYLANYIYY